MSYYIGRQLGNYRVTRLLGEGASAQVYLGEHIYLNTQAAIKVLKVQTTDYPQDLFYHEARNIARLVHPNIVRVLDFGVEGDVPFLVLDYAPNGTLRQRYPAGTVLPLAVVVSTIKQIAEALQYAHDEKLVHRDIKPENILLGRHNEVLLSDFGIALMMQTTQQDVQGIMGTLSYMAPEQIQGKPRPASDQYSLGIIAYEWLSGRRPFLGTITELISQHLVAPPPSLRTIQSTVSAEVEQVIMTALAKDPGNRFGSVRAFARALEQLEQTSQSQTTQSGQGEQPVVAGKEAIQTSVKQQDSVPQVNTESPAKHTNPITQPMPVGTIVSSYRGYLNAVRTLAWSPDNQRLLSTSNDGSVQLWDAITGMRQQLYQDTASIVQIAAWSSDGMRIATAGKDALIRLWDVSTGHLISTYRGHEGSAINTLAWSPTQPIFATAANGTIQVWDATTGQSLTIYQGHSGNVNALAWSPFGVATPFGQNHHIVSGGDDGMVKIWEVSTGRCIAAYQGQPARIASVAWSPNVYSSYSRQEPATSMHNSSRVACGKDDGMIEMWDTSINREVLSYRYTAAITTVAWSPDGRRFAYASAGQNIEIWDTITNLKLFTFFHPVPQRIMAWSANGKYIASGSEDGTIQVWVAPS